MILFVRTQFHECKVEVGCWTTPLEKGQEAERTGYCMGQLVILKLPAIIRGTVLEKMAMSRK